MADVKVTIPRNDYNPNQRTDIDVEVVNPDGSLSTRTVKGAVQSTTQEDGTVTFGILASAHVPFASGGGDYATEVLADSPLVYWRLGEASGTSAADESGNSRAGTYTNVTLGATGAIGDGDDAATFNGSNAQCFIVDAAWMDTATWSQEIWFKTSASTSGFPVFMSRANDDGAGRHFNFYLYQDDVYYEIYNTSGVGSPIIATGTYNDGNWHHAVGTWDGTTQKLYVDGSLEASATPSGIGSSFNRNFTIGARVGNSLWFTGDLDEMAWYDTALSLSRIQAHYNAA